MNDVTEDPKWIEADNLVKKDERVMLQVYRFIKINWKLFIGMFIGALIQWLIMK